MLTQDGPTTIHTTSGSIKINDQVINAVKRHLHEPEYRIKIAGKIYTAVDLAAKIFMNVREFVETKIAGDIEATVISVPISFNDGQREAVKRAANLAGLKLQGLINVPTAVALGLDLANRETKQRVLIYNLGAGM